MNMIWTAAAAVIAFAVTALLGKIMIPFLHRLKYGQPIRDEGPQWHRKKEGTPTMGGLMFIIGIAAALAICLPGFYATGETDETLLLRMRLLAGVGMALCYGLIGFFDDYIKVAKHRNLGLTAIQKLVLQFAVAAAYLFSVSTAGAKGATLIPFAGEVNLGWLYWPIAAILIVGFVNAVNLTDGIDGLNASITFFVGIVLMLIALFMDYESVSVAALALSGACLGFLVWNFNPAKVFMGDTGSLFLGGMVCALGFALNMPVILIVVGFVYLMEMFSVILQVGYFKITHGKRLFKMSPIHHHFEMCGWNEVKICIVFSGATAVLGAIAYLLVRLGL